MNRLFEDSRAQLISKGKSGASYAPQNQHLGKNRYQRRIHSKVAPSVKQYNEIDMDKFFKQDILDVNIEIRGETDNYFVKIKFGDVLKFIQQEVDKAGKLDLRCVTRALVTSFNSDNVYIFCSCPDFKYRFGHYALVKDLSSVDDQYWSNRGDNLVVTQSAKITNPRDDKGPGCKHIMLVLSNTTWLIKVASVVYNYINYMEKHYERLYQQFIYPAVYGHEIPDDTEVQLDIFDDTLTTDKETIDTSNKYARTKSQFQQDNEYRFQKEPTEKQFAFDELISDSEN